MIGRLLPSPACADDELAETFVPLRYDYGAHGDWVPVAMPGFPVATEIAAARACVAYLQRLWPGVEASAKIVCALTEHPDFDFDLGGISSDAVRDAARSLAERVARFDADVTRLLDAPEPHDSVLIGSVPYRHNPASGRVEPAPPANSAPEDLDDDDLDDEDTDDVREMVGFAADTLARLHHHGGGMPDVASTVTPVDEAPAPRTPRGPRARTVEPPEPDSDC